MKKSHRLMPMESARLLLEMAGPPAVRSDFEVVWAEAQQDGTLTRVVVRHLLNGQKFSLINDVPRRSGGTAVRSRAMTAMPLKGKRAE